MTNSFLNIKVCNLPFFCSHTITFMAYSLSNKSLFLVTLITIAMLCCYQVTAQDEVQGQNLAKALSCFDNKLIYVGCNQPYRLNPSGNINVPPEDTDFFCSGPCLTETQLVLNCIDNVLSNFIFHNRANVDQIRYALVAACNYAKERGSFNLGEYIGGETSSACRSPNSITIYLFILLVAAAVNLF